MSNWPFGPRQRPQEYNVPSQAPSTRRTYQPSGVDVAPQLPPQRLGQGGPAPVYVVSTYDARPINALDFNTQSGTNALDTGYLPSAAPADGYVSSSIFYNVPQGRVAVLRDWHILSVPQFGQQMQSPFTADGASNMSVRISLLVNGNFVLGYSNILSWGLPFGDIFQECYVTAGPEDEIELRVTSALDTVDFGGSWYQMLISLHGQLLLSKGLEPPFETGTDVVIPVHDGGV